MYSILIHYMCVVMALDCNFLIVMLVALVHRKSALWKTKV